MPTHKDAIRRAEKALAILRAADRRGREELEKDGITEQELVTLIEQLKAADSDEDA